MGFHGWDTAAFHTTAHRSFPIVMLTGGRHLTAWHWRPWSAMPQQRSMALHGASGKIVRSTHDDMGFQGCSWSERSESPCHTDRREGSRRMALGSHDTPCCGDAPWRCTAQAVRSFAEFTLEPFAPLKGKLHEGLTMTWGFMDGTQRGAMTRRVAAMIQGVTPRNR